MESNGIKLTRVKHHYKFAGRTHSGAYYRFFCDSHLGHLDGPYKLVLVNEFWRKSFKKDDQS